MLLEPRIVRPPIHLQKAVARGAVCLMTEADGLVRAGRHRHLSEPRGTEPGHK